MNQQMISAAWYEGRWWWRLLYPLLLPLSWLFSFVAGRRRVADQAAATPLAVPVIVVGNIAVGGTGKTPVIIALAKDLQARGLNPGIISRGYGSSAPYYPFPVTPHSKPVEVGDEPLLIAMNTQCPMMVGADRYACAQTLLAEYNCDILLSDDGMQHYRLPRQFELCVTDGARGVGNGRCLPAGPLREPVERLAEVDLIIINGELSAANRSLFSSLLSDDKLSCMQLQPQCWVQVSTGEEQPLDQRPWGDRDVVAASGIGNPQRFFDTLGTLGIKCENRAFDDHHPFCANDFADLNGRALLMTAKDAVKCRDLAADNWWYLTVAAEFDDAYNAQLDRIVASVRN